MEASTLISPPMPLAISSNPFPGCYSETYKPWEDAELDVTEEPT